MQVCRKIVRPECDVARICATGSDSANPTPCRVMSWHRCSEAYRSLESHINAQFVAIRIVWKGALQFARLGQSFDLLKLTTARNCPDAIVDLHDRLAPN